MNPEMCQNVSNAEQEQIKEEKREIIKDLLDEDMLDEEIVPYLNITKREYVIKLIKGL